MNTGDADNGIHFLDLARIVRVRFPIILLFLVTGTVAGSIATWMMPREYKAGAIIEVTEGEGLDIFGGGWLAGVSDPRFASTQLQIIQSKEVLYPVVDRLGLARKWTGADGLEISREEACRRLAAALDIRGVRNTSLLQIVAKGKSPTEAAAVANAVTDEYQKVRTRRQEADAEAGVLTLRDEVEKQRAKTRETSRELDRLRQELGISDLNPDSVGDPRDSREELLGGGEAEAARAANELSALKAKYEGLANFSSGDLALCLSSLGMDDPAAGALVPLYREAEAEVARLGKTGLGGRHPAVRAAAAKMESYRNQLEKQGRGALKSLAARVGIAEKSLAEAERRLEAERESQRQRRTSGAAYAAAKSAHIQAKKVLEAAEERLAAETMQKSMPAPEARIWERAEPSAAGVSPNVPLYVSVAAIAALLAGLGAAFFLEYLDTSARTMKDVESVLRTASVCVVPSGGKLLSKPGWGPCDAEPYQILRAGLEIGEGFGPGCVIAFTSGAPGEGKSTTVANLACAFAMGKRRVVVIDADMRRPTQHSVLGSGPGAGLCELLSGKLDLQDAVVATAVDGVHLVRAGGHAADPAAMLSSRTMTSVMDELRMRYDTILVDAPPILGLSEGGVTCGLADSTVVVVQHRRHPISMLERVRISVGDAGGRIAAAVLNNADVRYDEDCGYAVAYYGYYGRRVDAEASY